MSGESSNLPPRLYPIANESCEWFCGRAGADQQVFIYTTAHNSLKALFFDDSGTFVSARERRISCPDGKNPCLMDAVYNDFAISREIRAWCEELAITPGTIRIQRQVVEDIAIEDRPGYYDDFIVDPEASEPDPEERKRTRQFVERWDREGRFVLCFGKDYWMNGDGTIHST